MVNLTDGAVNKFKEVVEKQGTTGDGVRIFVVPGGWSPSLAMDIAKAAQLGDKTLEMQGLKVFLEERAHEMLMSTNIDFQEGQGFVLTGMQPSSCGSSCSC